MSEVNLVRNRHLVEDLGGALRSGQHGLSTVPGLLKRVLQEGSWREFTTQRDEHVQHERFVEFVTTPPLAGIGATVELLQRLVADDLEAAKLLRDALKGQGSRADLRNNSTEVRTITGTSRSYALDRLQRDAPELHAEVLAGKLSPHAAMVTAGFRPRTFTMRPDPESAARTLRKHLTAEQLADLARLLADT